MIDYQNVDVFFLPLLQLKTSICFSKSANKIYKTMKNVVKYIYFGKDAL